MKASTTMLHDLIVGPRKVGGRYLCGYWKQEYTVTAIDGNLMTCLWHDTGSPTTHCTAWNRKTDKIISEPLCPPLQPTTISNP